MKYNENFSSNRKKLGTGFFITLAVCMIIVGGAAWFALSRYVGEETVPETQSENPSSYKDESSQYNESVTQPPYVSSEETAKTTESEPYTASSTESNTNTDSIIAQSYTMPVQGEIIKDFSQKELQFSSTYGDMRLHSGIDIACENGVSVSACSDGTVTAVDSNTTYGNIVTIDHGKGILAKYCSLDGIKVKSGDKVKTGDVIGVVSAIPAECNDADHLHFEVYKDGVAVSPLKTLNLE